MLKYREIVDVIFLEFPKHFIAYVGVNGTVETVLRELSEGVIKKAEIADRCRVCRTGISPGLTFCRLRAAYIKYFVLPKDML